MSRKPVSIYMVCLFLSDVLLVLICLPLATQARLFLPYGRDLVLPDGGANAIVYAAVLLIWPLVLTLFGAYNLSGIVRIMDELPRVLGALILASLALAGGLYFAARDVSRLLIVYFALFTMVLLPLGRITLRLIFKARNQPRVRGQRILIAGAGELAQELARDLSLRSWLGLDVVGFLSDGSSPNGELPVPILGALDDASCVIRRHAIDEVIIAMPFDAHQRITNLVADLHEKPVTIKLVPNLLPFVFIRSSVEILGDRVLLGLKEPVLSPLQRLVKRTLDVAIVLPVLLVTLPAMAMIGVLVWLDSGRPVLFSQYRVGERGRLFKMLKFRTMVTDPKTHAIVEKQSCNGFYKSRNDPRVTRAGRVLRRTSLDELPQLFNILRGDMSLVGPRPELPELVAQYQPWQRRRLSVPQGLTGWWQINGRSDKPLHLHVEEDLYYIQNYSLWLDLQILFRTVGVVVRGKGAY
ncbi:MAG: sugar transferase [Ardenticatenaceae bacterium]|nr:sugar transferase [Ardenticatenaceae bacterium]